MIYEGKLKLLNDAYFISAAFVLAALVALYFLNILNEKYLYYVLGFSTTLVFSYFLTTSKVRVEINKGWLIIYYSGMVQANIEINSVRRLTEKSKGKMTGVEIETSDNLIFFMPTSCFDEAAKQEIISHLKNA